MQFDLQDLLYKLFAGGEITTFWPILAALSSLCTLIGVILFIKRRIILGTVFIIADFMCVTIIVLANLVAGDLNAYSAMAGAATSQNVVINISRGTNLTQVAKLLAENSIIADKKRFVALARYVKHAEFQAGEYELSSAMAPSEIIDILRDGRVKKYKITVPEGYNLWEIADLFDKSGLVKKEDFIRLATDGNFAKQLSIEAKTLEGYLYPDTYLLTRGVTAEKLIKEMVGHLKEVYSEEISTAAQKFNFTEHQVLTLASIIEKETGVPEERPIISGVFHNRLEKNMKLETDPTVIYAEILATGKFDKNITKDDLLRDHIYNTYLHKGLPPGPIASPGIDAIRAAVNPAKTSAFFFVSRNNGTHVFCPDFECHTKNVDKYQRHK